ncbi:MAG: DUF1385 domain-containing protein [Clostridia bacterium]|nr:DUF1385 domain-containing protein [Clostridia bacterium]
MSEIKEVKKTSIGGQALMEGLMMMGPYKISTCVRLANGEILEKTQDRPKASKAAKIPFLRGVVNLFTQMKIGVGELMFSAEQIDISEEEDKKETVTEGEPLETESTETETTDEKEPKKKDSIPAWALVLTVVFSLGLSICLFVLLPSLIVSFIPWDRSITGIHILSNLLEGVVRIAIFVGYLMLANTMKDMRRVWMYHGAEHKTIYCYESGMELTVENCRKFPKEHKRCGTSFMFLVMIIAILVFSIVPDMGRWLNLLIKFVLIPVVAGISYEVIKFAGNHETKFCNALSKPGMLFQKLTTQEPDDSMLEVAIKAMQNVIPEDQEADRW